MQVKEVRVGDGGDRFIVCFNPDQAERDAAVRARLIAQLEEAIAGSDALSQTERARIEGILAGKPGLKRTPSPGPPPAGTFRQSTEPTKPQRDIYTALSIEPPKKIISLAPAAPVP